MDSDEFFNYLDLALVGSCSRITNKLDQYDKGTFLCLLVAYKRKVGGKQLCAATLHCRGKPFPLLQPNQFLKEEMPVLMMKIGVE